MRDEDYSAEKTSLAEAFAKADALSAEQRGEIRAVLKLAVRCLAMIEETAPPDFFALRAPVIRSRIELSELLDRVNQPALRVVK